MPISEAQESKMIAARAARNKQNAKIPFLISIKDGRLMPNVPMLGGYPADRAPNGQLIPARLPHPDYRPYTGSLKATEDERLAWLKSAGLLVSEPVTVPDVETEDAAPRRRRAVVLSDEPPFDIGLATVAELIEFAKTEYGATLTPAGGLKALRQQVSELAQKAGATIDRPLA